MLVKKIYLDQSTFLLLSLQMEVNRKLNYRTAYHPPKKVYQYLILDLWYNSILGIRYSMF